VIAAVWAGAKIEKGFKKIIPDVVKVFIVPLPKQLQSLEGPLTGS